MQNPEHPGENPPPDPEANEGVQLARIRLLIRTACREREETTRDDLSYVQPISLYNCPPDQRPIVEMIQDVFPYFCANTDATNLGIRLRCAAQEGNAPSEGQYAEDELICFNLHAPEASEVRATIDDMLIGDYHRGLEVLAKALIGDGRPSF